MGISRAPGSKRDFATRLMLYMYRSCKRSEFDGIEIGVRTKKRPESEGQTWLLTLIHKRVMTKRGWTDDLQKERAAS